MRRGGLARSSTRCTRAVFADSDGDGSATSPASSSSSTTSRELGVDVVWLSPVYPSPQDDNGYDISDYQDVDPKFGTLADSTVDRGVHGRDMKLVMDLVVNHTSDEHPWFVESGRSRKTRSATGTGGGRRATGWSRRTRARSRRTGRRSSPGPAWELDETTGEYYLHLFPASSPTSTGRTRGPVGGLRDDALVARPGVDGFRMDVVNMLSKDPTLPDGPSPAASTATARPSYICGPRIHEFLAEMHREVFAGRPTAAHRSARCPGVTVDEARLFTDPGRDEVDMVFQFEHVALDQGASGKWDTRRSTCVPQGVVRALAARPGGHGLEQPLLEQP